MRVLVLYSAASYDTQTREPKAFLSPAFLAVGTENLETE